MKVKFSVKVNLEGLQSFEVIDGKAPQPVTLQEFKLDEFTVKATAPVEHVWKPAIYVAETEFEEEVKEKIIDFESVNQKVDALITTFRLFKNGYVGAFPIEVEFMFEGSARSYRIEQGISGMKKPLSLLYGLCKSEVDRLEQFASVVMPILNKIGSLREPAFLFFNRGIYSEAIGDYKMALVDFMSSLESALVSDDKELTHRLCERVAILNKLRNRKPSEEYEKCKDLYDKRSKIIHGVDVSKRQKTALEYAEAENTARFVLNVLLGYLSVEASPKKAKERLIDDIEKVIFGEAQGLPEHALALVKLI